MNAVMESDLECTDEREMLMTLCNHVVEREMAQASETTLGEASSIAAIYGKSICYYRRHATIAA